MSRSQQPQTPAWWFNGGAVPLWAALLAPAYASVVALRRWLYRRGWCKKIHPGVPVIVVGNLVAGGSGKTPLVIALVQRLQQAGFNPGVASRGYGRQQSKTARWVEAGMDAALTGDEPLLIAMATGAKVRVDRDRVAAACALVVEGCNVIVCDDGLQHYRLARDIEIEVQDARRRYGNGRMLPAGPLREPLERAADCTFRVLNCGVMAEIQSAGLDEWPMRLGIGNVRALSNSREFSLQQFTDQRIHAVAGIGEPERFFSMLRDAGIGVIPHAFPDHYGYSPDDFNLGSPLPVLMTEKDAVKCVSFAQPNWYVVPVEAQLPTAFWEALQKRLP